MQRNGEMTMHTCVEMEELVCGRNTKHIKKLALFEKVHDAIVRVNCRRIGNLHDAYVALLVFVYL